MDERVKQQIDKWRDELIDLSRRNRLLNYRPTKVSTLTVTQPGAAAVIARLLSPRSTGWRFYEPAVDDSGQPVTPPKPAKPDELVTDATTPQRLNNSLKGLNRRATDEFLDKGINILFLGVGMLEWVDVDGTAMRSPLMLVPVELVQTSPGEPYRLSLAEDDPVVNPALAVKLATDFDIALPDAEDADDAEADVTVFFDRVRTACGERAGWDVKDAVVLSFFSFHKHAMYRDLLENAAAISGHELIQALALGDRLPDTSTFDFEPLPEERLDEEAPPEKMASILDADATQRQCILAARDGRSFVMDGPPGTGKSQTIANMIAELLAARRSVLFVSEKAAALEVVDKRLRERGLDHFVLELHSHKATRKEVARTLGAALVERPRAREELTAADLRRLQTDRSHLSAYAAAHNKHRAPLGRSVHWAIGRLAQLNGLPELAPAAGISDALTADEFADIMEAAQDLALHWAPVAEGDEFLWRDLADPATARADIDTIGYELRRASAALDDLIERSAALADALAQPIPTTETEARWILGLGGHVASAPEGIHRPWLFSADLDAVQRNLARRSEQVAAYGAAASDLRSFGAVVRKPETTSPQTARGILALLDSLGAENRDMLGPSVACRALAEGAAAAGEAATTAAGISEAFNTITAAFGLPASETTVEALRSAVTLARLSDTDHRPEPEWIRLGILDQVRAARETVQPMIEAFCRFADDLQPTYEPSVLELDLGPVLVVGKAKLSRLSGTGRANRKALIPHVKGGKVTKEAAARLAEVKALQELSAELTAAGWTLGRMIGDRYYSGVATDFGALDAAIGCAAQALATAPSADPDRLADALCGRHHHLLEAAEKLERLANAWEKSLVPALAECGLNVAGMPVLRAAETIARVAGPLAQLRTAVNTIPGHDALSVQDLRRLAELRVTIADIEAAISADEDAGREILGHCYQGLDTDWEAIRKPLEWVETLRTLLGRPVAHDLEADALTALEAPTEPAHAALASYEQAAARVLGRFAPARSSLLRAELAVSFDDAGQLLSDLRDRVADVETWAVYTERCAELSAWGFGEFLDDATGRALPAEDLVDCTERALLHAWLAAVEQADPAVKLNQAAEDRDEIVNRFRELDARVAAHAVHRVVSACTELRPNSDVGAAGIIRRQASLQRRHLPVRRLLEQAGDVAQALKPCFMMSPLSVSTFLPPSMRFDVVIFDEASQVRPCDAVNAIYRGDQLIVAGDRHQLPPTSYFDRVAGDTDDVYDEEKLDEFESVLELAKGSPGIRSLPLRWHYRSRHEALITYSNATIYTPNHHPLITYPSAVDRSDESGVSLFHVADAAYGRGSTHDNPREAAAVVERVLHYATAYPDRTVGVVAFSEAQAQRIMDELDMARRGRPDLDHWFSADRLDGFFVKNLENVQGDERDVVIFSVGYGYDESGRLTLNFGPLNKPGGYRRLNVAITRARSRIEVVTSITHRDIDQQLRSGGNTNPGVQHLRDYLAYAAEGLDAVSVNRPSGDGEPESPFEESVLDVIQSWGWDVVSQVGQAGYRIDLGVRHPDKPGEFLLGIECDGWAYHSSPVARDRDRLRQEVLEGLGWRLHRIWGTAWYRRRQHEEDRLRAALEEARAGSRSLGVARPMPTGPVKLEVEEVDLSAQPDWSVPYEVACVTVPRGLTMDSPSARRYLEDVVKAVVDLEGPVALAILKNRAREAFRAGRVGANMQAAFDAAVNRLLRSGAIESPEAGFVDMPGRSVQTVRHAVEDPASRRTIDQIASAEIDLAILYLVADARSIDVDELKTRIRSLFGFDRTGRLIDVRIQSCLDRLARNGRLFQDGLTVRTAT